MYLALSSLAAIGCTFPIARSGRSRYPDGGGGDSCHGPEPATGNDMAYEGLKRFGISKEDAQIVCDSVREVARFCGIELDRIPSVDSLKSELLTSSTTFYSYLHNIPSVISPEKSTELALLQVGYLHAFLSGSRLHKSRSPVPSHRFPRRAVSGDLFMHCPALCCLWACTDIVAILWPYSGHCFFVFFYRQRIPTRVRSLYAP